MICPKCGGFVQVGVCKLCEMFEAGSPPGGTCTGWPMKSRSMAVAKHQVQEANQFLSEYGITSREAMYEKDGTLTLESAKAKKKVIAARNKATGSDRLKDLSSFN